MKTEEITFRNTFRVDKHLCFLAGKSDSTLQRSWLGDTGYPICYYFPLFAPRENEGTVCPLIFSCSPLFATFSRSFTRARLALHACLAFASVRLKYAKNYACSAGYYLHHSYYSVFAIWDYSQSLFATNALQVFQTPRVKYINCRSKIRFMWFSILCPSKW